MGGRKSQKKKKVRAPGRPAKTGRKTGCGTGAGGFGEGNDCAKEDGVPNRPLPAGGALKMPNVKQLKKEVAREKAAAAAAAEKQRRKEIQAKKKAAVARKQAKDQKSSAEKQAADAARAKKRAEMLQKIRIKKANEKVSVVGTPKSVAEQLAEAKTAMKQKTAEASKQLTVAGTPKSIKQEIDEAKAKALAEAQKNAAEEAAAKQKAILDAQADTASKGKPAPVKKVGDEHEKALEAVKNPDSTPPPASLKVEKNLGGTTGAQLAVDAGGKKYVIKSGKTKGHIESESQADDLYRAAGAEVPKQQLHKNTDGTSAKVAEFIDGKTLGELKATNTKQYEAAVAKIKKHFVADALLGNYDVVGANLDNIVVGKGGKVFRVDNGGSLTFRAQGKNKEFGPEVTEISSLRDASINSASASVFGSLTNREISAQITQVLKRKDQIVAAAKTEELRDTLSKRLDSLAAWQKSYKKSLKSKPVANPGYQEANGTGLKKAVDSVENADPAVKAAVASGKTSSGMAESKRDAAVRAVWEYSLTSAEREAATFYGASGYVQILSVEKQGAQAIAQHPKTKAFASAVAKLPKYHGKVTRRLDNIKSAQIKSWLKSGRWSTEHPDAPGNPTHASFSTIDKAASIESSIKNGSAYPKGNVVVVIQNNTRAADTGKRLPHNSEKEVLLPPSLSNGYKVAEHYWILDKSHAAVKKGAAKKGDRIRDDELTKVMGGNWDQSKEDGATFVLIVDEDSLVAVGKAKPKKKKA
jgi:hypothetical protein